MPFHRYLWPLSQVPIQLIPAQTMIMIWFMKTVFFLGIGNIDLDSKDKIEELKNTVSYLGKQNEQLKNRVSFLFLLVLFFL